MDDDYSISGAYEECSIDNGIIVGASLKSVFTGGVTKYVNDHNNPVVKDNVILSILPEKVPECLGSVVTGHCISKKTLMRINQIISTNGNKEGSVETEDRADRADRVDRASSVESAASSVKNIHTEVVERAKEKLGCSTELCILEALEPQLGRAIVSAEIKTNFKIPGPTDNKLLSNINIDAIMNRFAELFPGFYPYNFNMRNYASYSFRQGYVENSPDSLATIQFRDLYANGHNCCGCVINADTYQGPGTHWMALFADARGGKWSVEFFNSSGQVPAPEWVNWMTKTKSQMEDLIDRRKDGGVSTRSALPTVAAPTVSAPTVSAPTVSAISGVSASRGKIGSEETTAAVKKLCCDSKSFGKNISTGVDIVCCSEIRHQQSKTECGLYSLFYIFARLNGVPYEYFMKNPVPDQLMFEFRQLLFKGEKGLSGGKFNWNQYKGQVSVSWE